MEVFDVALRVYNLHTNTPPGKVVYLDVFLVALEISRLEVEVHLSSRYYTCTIYIGQTH